MATEHAQYQVWACSVAVFSLLVLCMRPTENTDLLSMLSSGKVARSMQNHNTLNFSSLEASVDPALCVCDQVEMRENAPLFKEGYVLKKNIMDGPHRKSV